MDFRADNFYATWRERSRAAGALHDDGPVPPEKLLQAIWQHQRIHQQHLHVDGVEQRVVDCGDVWREWHGQRHRDVQLHRKHRQGSQGHAHRSG